MFWYGEEERNLIKLESGPQPLELQTWHPTSSLQQANQAPTTSSLVTVHTFSGLLVVVVFRFVKGSIIVVPVTGVLWVLIFLFAAGACPISMLYGLLLRCNIITFSTKMRNFLINHNQDKCRFSSCCLTVYVETPEAQDAPRVW